jgi:DNA-directed RNA polymerase subunit H (RpoH/RPB5)
MEDVTIIHRALSTWDRIQQARHYEQLAFYFDPEYVVPTYGSDKMVLSWPLPPVESFFNWVLSQPGVYLPHLTLEGRAPMFDAVPLTEDSDDSESDEELEGGGESGQRPTQFAPAITVFAHSDKFEKEYSPAQGVPIRTSDNLGVSEMRAVLAKFQRFLKKHADAPLIHLNALVYCNVTSPSEKLLHDFFDRWKQRRPVITTVFSMVNDLQWFKLDHKLILPHQILSKEAIDAELVKTGVDMRQLPQLHTCDPVAQILALRPGMIVKIRVPLDSLDDIIYRIVVERSADATTSVAADQDDHDTHDDAT